MSTASFITVTLNKRGVKNVFQLHYWQYKMDTTSVFKSPLFSSLVKSAILIRIKVVSIELLKQKLVLITTHVVVIMTFTTQKQYCFCCVGMLY